MTRNEKSHKKPSLLLKNLKSLNGSLDVLGASLNRSYRVQSFWPIQKAPAGSRALRAAEGSPGSTARNPEKKQAHSQHKKNMPRQSSIVVLPS